MLLPISAAVCPRAESRNRPRSGLAPADRRSRLPWRPAKDVPVYGLAVRTTLRRRPASARFLFRLAHSRILLSYKLKPRFTRSNLALGVQQCLEAFFRQSGLFTSHFSDGTAAGVCFLDQRGRLLVAD